MNNLKEVERYELIPTNGRKSFYGKATVSIYNDGTKRLYSYNTPILEINADGEKKRLYGYDLSMTTSTHLKSFCGMTKKEFEKMKCN